MERPSSIQNTINSACVFCTLSEYYYIQFLPLTQQVSKMQQTKEIQVAVRSDFLFFWFPLSTQENSKSEEYPLSFRLATGGTKL